MIHQWVKDCSSDDSSYDDCWASTRILLETMITFPFEKQPILYEKWIDFLKKEKDLKKIQKAVDDFKTKGKLPVVTVLTSSKKHKPYSPAVFQFWLGSYLFGIRMPPMAAATAGFIQGLFTTICKCAQDHKEELVLLSQVLPLMVPSSLNPYYIKCFQQTIKFLTFLDANPKKIGTNLIRYGLKNYETTKKTLTSKTFSSSEKYENTMKNLAIFFPGIGGSNYSAKPDSPSRSPRPTEKVQQKQRTLKKTELISKHASALTKNINSTTKLIMEKIESKLETNPYILSHPEILPAAIGVLYGVKKAIVIDKYESLTRSLNNTLRRCLGQKIKPTKHTPIELLTSGKVRPIIRRDILMSNFLILFR